jgi:hypothetical protein
MRSLMVGAAALALVGAGLTPAFAQTTQQFMVAGAPVTIGTMPASEGKGYSVYHYRSLGHENSVNVNCMCDGAKPTTGTCDDVEYKCSCPSAKLTCTGGGG